MQKRFTVSGRVQGVSFRAAAQRAAERLRVGGWIRNLSTGQVEGVVAGHEVAVQAFLAWCAVGPSGARVDEVVVTEEPSAAFTNFSILRGD